MIETVRRRAEFLLGGSLVIIQHLAQRIEDGARDAASAVGRERRNARFVGEMTVRALQRTRGAESTGVAVSAPVSPIPVESRPTASGVAHLGVAELVSAIPAMSPDQRRALLAEERAGRNRTRVVQLLEQLGA